MYFSLISIKKFIFSNQQLQDLVNEEIGKLKDFIQNRTMASVPGNGTIEEELYDAQVTLFRSHVHLKAVCMNVINERCLRCINKKSLSSECCYWSY